MSQVFTKFFVFSLIFLLSAQCSEAADKYKPGRHYEVLSQPVLTRDNSKVEVIEFFGLAVAIALPWKAHLLIGKKNYPLQLISTDTLSSGIKWWKLMQSYFLLLRL